jgi:hypothetical protein
MHGAIREWPLLPLEQQSLTARLFRNTKWNGACLEFGCRSSGGYGAISIRGIVIGTHRVAYELYHGAGSIGDLHVLHRCDNRACINHQHLFLGDHTDNMRDMREKRRKRK